MIISAHNNLGGVSYDFKHSINHKGETITGGC